MTIGWAENACKTMGFKITNWQFAFRRLTIGVLLVHVGTLLHHHFKRQKVALFGDSHERRLRTPTTMLLLRGRLSRTRMVRRGG